MNPITLSSCSATIPMQFRCRRQRIKSSSSQGNSKAIEDADVTVLVLDSTSEIGKQDKRIASIAIESGTGLILLVNKIDLLTTEEKEIYLSKMEEEFAFCAWAPVIFTSANTRENLPKLFELLESVCRNRQIRITTPILNRWFSDIIAKYQPRGIGGKSAKAKYVTQIDVAPPTFMLFLKDPKRLHFSSLRFMENKLRKQFGFEGTPMRWIKRGKEE